MLAGTSAAAYRSVLTLISSLFGVAAEALVSRHTQIIQVRHAPLLYEANCTGDKGIFISNSEHICVNGENEASYRFEN